MNKVFPQADFLLVSRNLEGMQITRQQMSQESTVRFHQLDLGALDGLEERIDALVQPLKGKYSKVFVFSNAGSLGPLETVADLNDFKSIREAIDLNVTSTVLLISKCLQVFADCERLNLINISSLTAIKPYHSAGIYCIGKAARAMLLAVIAEEVIRPTLSLISQTKEVGNVKTLNFSPGPMATDMLDQLIQSKRNEPWIKMKETVLDILSLWLNLQESIYRYLSFGCKACQAPHGRHIREWCPH